MRRRLRAILAELDRSSALPPVIMLIGATPAANKLTFDQLRRDLEQLVQKVAAASLR